MPRKRRTRRLFTDARGMLFSVMGALIIVFFFVGYSRYRKQFAAAATFGHDASPRCPDTPECASLTAIDARWPGAAQKLAESYSPASCCTTHRELKIMLGALAAHMRNRGLEGRWWIGQGSLLGLRRHRGIVPWDSDLDVFVLANPGGQSVHTMMTRSQAIDDTVTRLMKPLADGSPYSIEKCEEMNYGRLGQTIRGRPHWRRTAGGACSTGCPRRQGRWWPTSGEVFETGDPVPVDDSSGVLCSTAFKLYRGPAGAKIDIQIMVLDRDEEKEENTIRFANGYWALSRHYPAASVLPLRPCPHGFDAFGVDGLLCPNDPDAVVTNDYGVKWRDTVVASENYWRLRSNKKAALVERREGVGGAAHF